MALSAAKEYVPSYQITVGGEKILHGHNLDVISLGIIDTCNQGDSFTFTIRDRHPDKGRFPSGGTLVWLDGGKLEEGKEVKIELGWQGNTAVKFLGVISAVTPTFPESGTPTIIVRGQSLYAKLLAQCDTKPFKEKTDSGIAEEIAKALGLGSRVKTTTAEHPLVSSRSGTYASILQERATRIGYELVVKEKTLYFEPPRYLEEKGPLLTLEWGRSLKSFSPTLSTYRKVTNVKVRASQTSQGKGKEALEGTAGPGEERAKLGKESASEIALKVSGKNELLADDHLAVSQQEAKEVALAKLEASSIEFITGRGTCNGNPDLKARTVIEIKGIGSKFSGNYYVTSVTHTIDGSGYRCDFEVKRNGR